MNSPLLNSLFPEGLPARIGSCTVHSFLSQDDSAALFLAGSDRLLKLFLLKPKTDLLQVDKSILIKLSHPSLARLFSAGMYRGMPYLEMEMIRGQPLSDVLKNRGALPLESCTAIAILICRALSYLHQQKSSTSQPLLHLNLKPSKVMLCDEGGVKLLGTAQNHCSDSEVPELLRYCSPEMLGSDICTTASDVYSLGCILYEMICGANAFPQKNLKSLSRARKRNSFVPLGRYKIRIPSDLKRLVQDCMKSNPHRRPDSVQSVLERLERVHNHFSRHAPQDVVDYLLNATVGRIDLKKRFPVFSSIVVTVLILVSVYMFSFYRINPDLFSFEQFVSVANSSAGDLTDSPETTSGNSKDPHSDIPHYDSSQDETITALSDSQSTLSDTLPVNSPENDSSVQNPDSIVDTIIVAQADSQTTGTLQDTIDNSLVEMRPNIFIDQLRRFNEDILELYKTEMGGGNYDQGLKIYDHLSPQQKQNAEVQLLRMRALVVLRRTGDLNRFFSESEINDKEYFFAKGFFYYERGRYKDAMELMKRCRTANANYSDSYELDKRAAFYLALCYTKFFEQDPNEENRRTALDSWFDVKYLYRSDRKDRNFNRAEEEIRRLSNVKMDGRS